MNEGRTTLLWGQSVLCCCNAMSRERAMSKLGRLIQRRRENKHLSPIEPTVYQENGEITPDGRISEIPINELLPVGTDTAIKELNEIREHLKQASLERGQAHVTEAEGAVHMFTSHRAQEKVRQV
jgi:hypothetical protein